MTGDPKRTLPLLLFFFAESEGEAKANANVENSLERLVKIFVARRDCSLQSASPIPRNASTKVLVDSTGGHAKKGSSSAYKAVFPVCQN